MKIFFYSIIGFIAFLVFIVGMQAFGIVNYQFFGAWKKDVQREVFTHSKSFVEGKKQEIFKYKIEYERAETPQEKQAIRIIILNSASEIDESELPYKTQQFLNSLQ